MSEIKLLRRLRWFGFTWDMVVDASVALALAWYFDLTVLQGVAVFFALLGLYSLLWIATQVRALLYCLFTYKESIAQQALWLRSAGFPRPGLVFSMETYMRETANDPAVAADVRVQAAESLTLLTYSIDLMGLAGAICVARISDAALLRFADDQAR